MALTRIKTDQINNDEILLDDLNASTKDHLLDYNNFSNVPLFNIPLFLSDGSVDAIQVTTQNEIPFFLSDGTEDNIPLTG
jgi:hypothetical protein